MKKAMTWAALITLAVTGSAGAQVGSGIYVNGKQVTRADLQVVGQILGVPMEDAIAPGQYWYDQVSGLWGYPGTPAIGQIPPGLPLGGPLQAGASGGGTGIFINGREIHVLEAQYLRMLFGYVIPGRYWMNAAGIGGFENGPPMFNLVAAAQQAGWAGGGGGGAGGGDYNQQTLFGGLGGDGNCSYYLHPDGPSVMTC
jgi:hypothetical protein